MSGNGFPSCYGDGHVSPSASCALSRDMWMLKVTLESAVCRDRRANDTRNRRSTDEILDGRDIGAAKSSSHDRSCKGRPVILKPSDPTILRSRNVA